MDNDKNFENKLYGESLRKIQLEKNMTQEQVARFNKFWYKIYQSNWMWLK